MFDNATNTIVYDASDGIFSDVYDASTVVASYLQQSDTNQIADQQAVIQLRSIHYEGGEDNNITIKFYNYSSTFVTIRWIDNKGQYSPSHTWILAPYEELNQQTSAGHIFVLSIPTNGSDEAVLGAFRPKRTLPSGTHHSVQVHDGETSDYILEVILAHRYDALVVSSFWLNRNIVMKQTRQDATKTLKILHKIVSNVIQDRSNETYRKLRLSNDTVKRYICNWAVLEYLRVLGFQKKTLANDQGEAEGEEEYLIAENIPDDTTLALYVRGLALIEILQSRCQPGFVADLAPPTPWEIPIQPNDNGSGNRRGRGGRGRWGTAGSTNMMNPDDRWARVERARNFRRSAGPRPSPGNAPSDRGRWGRPR